MTISTTDARALFTKMLISVYKERVAPTAFLRSFFRTKESVTKELSIEVQRGTEKIAVDVQRGTEGRRNSFSKSTEKLFVPPYYREFFDATELDLYDRLFGSTDIEASVFAAFMDSVGEKLAMLIDKIERAYELQCAQVLTTGIVELQGGINIDFKRKAASLVDKGAGNYWTTGTVNPLTDIENAGIFLRQKGKIKGAVLNAIMGAEAHRSFMENAKVLAEADVRRIDTMAIREPQRNSVGATTHGYFSTDNYKVNIWTYPEYYENSSGISVPYLDPKKVIVLPENPNFELGFAAVPQLVGENSQIKKGAYIIEEYKDLRRKSHIFDVQSAGVAIPVAVDQIYTVKVVAG